MDEKELKKRRLIRFQDCIISLLMNPQNNMSKLFIRNFFLDTIDDPQMQESTESFLRILEYMGYVQTTTSEMIKNFRENNFFEAVFDLRQKYKKIQDSEKNLHILADQLNLRLAKFLDNDRWTTVIKFFDVINKEQDWKGKKATRETMIRKTQEALSNKQCFSMFKSKKEGRYYRIEDIVDAAMSLEYVRQEYKWSVIEEMKYKDNSRTKTELDSEGFETSERKESGI